MAALVAIILGSKSDRGIIKESGLINTLESMGIECEISCISAHRNPEELVQYVNAKRNSVDVFIAAAGMSAALPGAIAAYTGALTPVIGVALPSDEFPNCMDAAISITRMPPGVPVNFTGFGVPGLKNAAISAAQIIATNSASTRIALKKYITENTKPAQLCVEISGEEV
jgi:phosphoribosylaminoimidazole carboxylase PurE protein